jgi:putative membrane-bound dehydrogenase-like protein
MARHRLVRIGFSTLAFAISATSRSAEPSLDPKDLPRTPPVEAKDALRTFKIKPGFHLELVAAEPLVRDPIEMCFDENGRLFVVEMIDYSELRDAQPHLGRVRLLEDTDEDGRFDKSTVYADDLPWPTAVFCWAGGIFVAATPDIFHLKDTNGDGKADVRRVVFTGFASDYAPYATNTLNMQAMVNSFRWGLDNRIHGLTGPNGGHVRVAADVSRRWMKSEGKGERGEADQSRLTSAATNSVDLRGRDFAFDPRTLALTAEAGGGQYGLSFDNWGRRFTCNNSDHVRVFMYDARYAARNPFFNLPPALVSIAADGPAAEVFRLSPEEPWRVIRTKWRVAGQVPGPIEGGGRASGYFTSAAGITIYRGNAYPEDFVGDAFICDVGSNLVHRKKLRPHGVALIAERPADEQKSEFLASTDLWFRPVQFANAPDGCLYLADMYREVIEHPWSIPPAIKKLLDLNSGNDRGRIYRIVPDGFRQPKLPRLGKATTAELVATLDHPNGWHRDTAARLLYERQDTRAVEALQRLSVAAKSAEGRLHALYALDGLGALKPAPLLNALGDAHERVREHAVKLSGKFSADERLAGKLLAMAADPSVHVRYQLAFTLGEVKHPDRIKAMAEIAQRDADSPWVQAAVLSSLAEGAGEMFALLGAGGPRTSSSAAATKAGHTAGGDARSPGQQAAQADFLRQLGQLIGAKNDPGEVATVIGFVRKVEEPARAFALVRALGEGLQRARGALPRAELKPIFDRAAELAANARAAEGARVAAIQLLGLTSFAESGQRLLAQLDERQPPAVQLAALAALGRFNDPQVGGALTARWASLTPRLREEALTVLLARADRAAALLRAIADGVIRPSDLSSTQAKFLKNHRDAKVREQAVALLTAPAVAQRPDVVNAFLPALNLAGDAARGKAIFLERCASCHRLGGEGFALGPDLVSVKTGGKEKMLVNILDPNRELLPQFRAYEVETKDDESLLGLIANETAASVTVRQAYGRETVVPRAGIARMRSQGQSLMPEGLEQGLTPQAMADLLEFIATAEADAK